METATISRRELRRALMDHNISMKQFAKMVGISHQHFYMVMEGQRSCSRVVMLRIRDVLKELGDPPPEPPEGVMVRVRQL
jgi:predicted transcriptional regulator